jgi:hypothetical protein
MARRWRLARYVDRANIGSRGSMPNDRSLEQTPSRDIGQHPNPLQTGLHQGAALRVSRLTLVSLPMEANAEAYFTRLTDDLRD